MTNSKPYIHPSAIVETSEIGLNTRIWAFVHILKEAQIGENCNICDHCFIENDVIIGNNVTIKCGIYLWDGTKIENNVMLGPNVVFTNDLRPRSKYYDKKFYPIIIQEGASIGANSTLLAGITIGKYAMTGIGSVITRNVPNHALVYGNPAKQHGWVDFDGRKLKKIENNLWQSENGTVFTETVEGLAVQISN